MRRSRENSFGTLERELRLRSGVPQVGPGRRPLKGITVDFGAGVQAEGRKVVLQEVLGLVVANDHEHIRLPFVETVAQDAERIDDFLLVADVLAQSVVLSKLVQEARRRLVARYAGKYPLSALGPYLGRRQDDWAVRATQPQ